MSKKYYDEKVKALIDIAKQGLLLEATPSAYADSRIAFSIMGTHSLEPEWYYFSKEGPKQLLALIPGVGITSLDVKDNGLIQVLYQAVTSYADREQGSIYYDEEVKVLIELAKQDKLEVIKRTPAFNHLNFRPLPNQSDDLFYSLRIGHSLSLTAGGSFRDDHIKLDVRDHSLLHTLYVLVYKASVPKRTLDSISTRVKQQLGTG